METLISEELLTRKECDSVDFGADELSVDYEKQYAGLDEQCTPKAVAGCRRTDFRRKDSFGGILFMIGITIKRQSMHGGLNDFPFALSYMMWYA